MELIKFNNATADEATEKVVETQFRELNDLQLALIGGGIGDPIAF
jgi:hypothetical protein